MPAVLHRAIYGSFERFIAILIEHYAGAFPAWLAPVQVAILTVADRQLPGPGRCWSGSEPQGTARSWTSGA